MLNRLGACVEKCARYGICNSVYVYFRQWVGQGAPNALLETVA